MKKKDKYKLINYAINEYSETFEHNYKRMHLSKKYLLDLLKKFKHSTACEWSYCCYGLYNNCWQEPYFEGNWGMSQKGVDDMIKWVITHTDKNCKRDSRIGYFVDGNDIHVVIVARDLPEHTADYLITFTNEKWK